MSSSPYLSASLQTYMKTHKIEELINHTTNTLLKSQPQDPYGFIIGLLQQKASSDIKIVSIKGFDTIISVNGDVQLPAIKLKVRVEYLNKQFQFILGDPTAILSEEGNIYDGQESKFSGKGLNKALQFLNHALASKIANYKCSQITDIDKQLLIALNQNKGLGVYIINIVSYAVLKIQANVLSAPLHQIVSNYANDPTKKRDNPKIMLNCLQGGKAIGSKCKVFKYLLFSRDNNQDAFLANTIMQNIRKAIVAGKGGEAALKLSPDQTFICPVDTILDNLKIVEDAINTSNAKDMFYIGLSWAADTLYSQDTKKYQLQNPKTPFDNDQMIEYLIKLCVDKPLIKYLEDPLASTEKASWRKLKVKLEENPNLKDVKLGTNPKNSSFFPALNTIHDPNFEDSLKESLINLSIQENADSHPQLTPQVRTEHNSLKFSLDLIQFRLYQLRTFSNVLKCQKIFGKTKTNLVLGDNQFETTDTISVDVCYGFGAVLGISSINGNKCWERICKLNRINQINKLSQFK